MQIKEKTKAEVESKSAGMSDFLKMEYLEECLRSRFSFDVKKYCNIELAKAYEVRRMFAEAAKNLEQASEISLTFREKKELFLKAAELYVKAESYERANLALRKALEQVPQEKEDVRKALKKLVKEQAAQYEQENRRGSALKAYEYLYKMLEENEKAEMKQKLLELYGKLGKISEYNILKGS